MLQPSRDVPAPAQAAGSRDTGAVRAFLRKRRKQTGAFLRGRARALRRPATALRVVAHLAAWAPFVWAAVFLSERGWTPVSDGASIAIRSWDALSAHGPLVGQATRLATGVFDPGPLEYWLLALPVHIDPARGALWGAALFCMVAASLAVEAAWSVARAAGALLASGVVLGLLVWMPGIALQPFWNPWFGVMFLLPALAASWAVFAGKRSWLPVLAITASIAAQAHIMFALMAGALVVAGGIVTLVGAIISRKGQRWKGFAWLAGGFLAGAICWTGPVIQQIEGPLGNLSALVRGQTSGGSQLAGWWFGFKALAGSAQPPAIWWKPLQSLLNIEVIGQRSAVYGIVTLAVLVAVLVLAIRPLRSRGLAALAGVGLLASVTAVFTYAGIAVQSFPANPNTLNTINYLMILMLPVGLICWLAVVAAISLAARRRLAGRPHRPARRRHERGTEPSRGRRIAVRLGACCAVLAVAAVLPVTASISAATTWHQFPGASDIRLAHDVAVAAGRIEKRLPGQPVQLFVRGHGHNRRLLFGLALALKTRGYSPELPPALGESLGPAYIWHGKPIAQAWVSLRHHRFKVVEVFVHKPQPGA